MSDYSTELPFPNRVNSANSDLFKEHYRPTPAVPGRSAKGNNAAEPDIPDTQSVLTLSAATSTGRCNTLSFHKKMKSEQWLT